MRSLHLFLMKALTFMHFPLSTALIMYHKFGDIVHLFSLNSRISLISLFHLWLSYYFVESCSGSCGSVYCFCCYSPALIYDDLIECKGLFISSITNEVHFLPECMDILNGVSRIFSITVVCVSKIIKIFEYAWRCLLDTYISPWENFVFSSVAYF